MSRKSNNDAEEDDYTSPDKPSELTIGGTSEIAVRRTLTDEEMEAFAKGFQILPGCPDGLVKYYHFCCLKAGVPITPHTKAAFDAARGGKTFQREYIRSLGIIAKGDTATFTKIWNVLDAFGIKHIVTDGQTVQRAALEYTRLDGKSGSKSRKAFEKAKDTLMGFQHVRRRDHGAAAKQAAAPPLKKKAKLTKASQSNQAPTPTSTLKQAPTPSTGTTANPWTGTGQVLGSGPPRSGAGATTVQDMSQTPAPPTQRAVQFGTPLAGTPTGQPSTATPTDQGGILPASLPTNQPTPSPPPGGVMDPAVFAQMMFTIFGATQPTPKACTLQDKCGYVTCPVCKGEPHKAKACYAGHWCGYSTCGVCHGKK